MFRKLTLALCALVLMCTPVAAKTLVVAGNCAFPPMEFLTDKKVPTGYSIDYIHEIAKRANLKITFRDVAWDGIFAGLAAGNYDILASSTTITPERQQAFDFTIPYYGAVQAVVMPKGKKINSLADLKGLTVGSQIGITGVFVLRKADVGAKIKEYDDIGLAFEDLAAGRTDAVICDDPVAKYYANKRADFAGKFNVAYLHKDPEYYGFCLRKGDTELLNQLNTFMAEIEADGTFDEIVNKYFGDGEAQPVESASEMKTDGSQLIVATNAAFEPFEYMVGENYYGLDLEIMALFAESIDKELYINNMEFDAVCLSVSAAGGSYEDENGNEVSVAGGVCDVAAAGLTVSDSRKEILDFSTSYYSASQMLIVAEDDTTFDACQTKEDVEAILRTLGADVVVGVQTSTTGQKYCEGDADWGFDGFGLVEIA